MIEYIRHRMDREPQMTSKAYGILFAVALATSSSSYAAQQGLPTTAPASAQAVPTVIQFDTITVTGTQPGPGMWRVSDGSHELWIMGSLSPLPDNITWNFDKVSPHVLQAQEVIWEPMFRIDTDAGFFKKLYLGFRFYQATKNPDGQTLKDVLSPELYARWSRLKQTYLPRDRGVERRRPLLAAGALLNAALRHRGLSTKRIVEPTIIDLVKKHQIKATLPTVSVKIDDPAAALDDARKITLSDSACLEATLDTIENDLQRMVTNANAWSTGDIDRIEVDSLKRRNKLCSDAFSGAEFARKRGIPDIEESGKARWLSTAEAALKHNRMSFSVVPLQDILGADGYLARLTAKGYSVEHP